MRGFIVSALVLILLVAVAVLIWGPQLSRTDKVEEGLAETAQAFIEGVVLDTDGQPVAGAYVWSHSDGFHCRSGPDGSFRVRVDPNQRLLLYAVPDRASRAYSERRSRAAAGGDRVVLTVPAGATVRFRLSEQPPAGRTVIASLTDRERGEMVRLGAFDERGCLDLACLPATRAYGLYAHEDESGDCVLITGIQARGQEIAVGLSPPQQIRGLVRMPEGARLHQVHTVFDWLYLSAEVEPTGEFVFRRVPAGSFQIQAVVLLDGVSLYGSTEAAAGETVQIDVCR